MKIQKRIQTMVIAALLCAVGIVIPMFCPKIIIEPASFTLASHVPLFLAMFISLPVAAVVCLGTTLGFFLSGFPLVVVLRALSQIVFVALGAWFLQHSKNIVNRPLKSTLFSLVMGLIHGACETLVSTWFYFNGSETQQGYLMSVIVLVGVGYVTLKGMMTSDKAMPVRQTVIDGALNAVNKKDIADIIGRMTAGENISTLDLSPVLNTLSQIPWIAHVEIEKQMPDTLIVSIVEHEPAAFWKDNGLYDAKTQSVFYPDLRRFKRSLVKLSAYHDNLAPEVYAKTVLFIKELKRAPLQLVAVNLDNIRCYHVILSNGTELVLGRNNDNDIILRRLRRFVDVYRQTQMNLDEINYVDLRYDVGFAVNYKKESDTKNTKKQE